MNPPDYVAEAADKLHHIISEATQMSMLHVAKLEGQRHNRTHSLYVGAVGGVALIHLVASLVGWHGDTTREDCKYEDVPKLINPTSTLLACFLLHGMCPEASGEGRTPDGVQIGVNISFGPQVILDAVQQVERFTGRPVDGWVNPQMLKQTREVLAGSEEPLNKFMAQRRQTPGNLH